MIKKIFVLSFILFNFFVCIDFANAECKYMEDARGKKYYPMDARDIGLVDDDVSLTVETNDSICKLYINNRTCGNIGYFNKKIPELTSWFFTLIEVIVPIILIILGVIDFVKSLSGSKEDDIKKGQQIFIKRILTASIIFFVIVGVKLLINIFGNSFEKEGILDCVNCFINNKCSY